MSLIKCSECDNQVSDRASACPKCGAPVASKGTGTPVTTIQKTSKRLKLQRILAGIFFFIGVVALIFNGTYASQVNVSMSAGVIIFFIIGFVWYVSVKVRIWWNHD